MKLPQANVRLLKISSPGQAADFNRPAGAAVDKWTGDEGAYLQEKLVSNLATSQGGELNRVKSSTLIMPGNLSPSIDLATGDVVTFKMRDGASGQWVTTTREIQNIASAIPPMAGLLRTVRLSLRDATA